jgi:hypothetical protein
MDTLNYRADFLHKAGLNSNKSLLFNIPSYSGIIGYMPKRFFNLIHSFGYPATTVLIYPSESIQNDRFRDISAVRYTFDSHGNLQTRGSALSRLRLFNEYHVIEDDAQALIMLKSDEFHPQQQVILTEEPSTPIHILNNKESEFIPIEQATQDKVRANVKIQRPSLLLFAESYDKGWKVYIDGQPRSVVRANYNFMACAVPAGKHRIEFVDEPWSFFVCRYITLFGLIAMGLIGGILFLQERRIKHI